jgi:hypothetical protein
MPRQRLMGAALKLFAGLSDGRDGSAGDRALDLALRLVPPLEDGARRTGATTPRKEGPVAA